jgi:hypothetical protein
LERHKLVNSRTARHERRKTFFFEKICCNYLEIFARLPIYLIDNLDLIVI